MKYIKYFSRDFDGNIEFHITEQEAKASAENFIKEALSDDFGWCENVTDICWGEIEIKQSAVMENRREDQDGIFDYICDYNLRDIPRIKADTSDRKKPKTHVLKIDIKPRRELVEGKKDFELRYNDRGYRVGDTLVLQEVYRGDRTSSPDIIAEIKYILTDSEYPGLKRGFVILGLKKKGSK